MAPAAAPAADAPAPAPSATDEAKAKAAADAAEAERELKARRRMLGNIQFIGHLYKCGLLTERIIHSCIIQLLSEEEAPRPDDIECLCKLLTTLGKQVGAPVSDRAWSLVWGKITGCLGVRLCAVLLLMGTILGGRWGKQPSITLGTKSLWAWVAMVTAPGSRVGVVSANRVGYTLFVCGVSMCPKPACPYSVHNCVPLHRNTLAPRHASPRLASLRTAGGQRSGCLTFCPTTLP